MSQGGGGMRGYVQQDAEEFYNTLIAEVQAGLHSLPAEAVTQEENSFNSLLGLRLQETVQVYVCMYGCMYVFCLMGLISHTLQCQESDQEPILSRSEEVNKLVCNIQNTVNHMHESVKLGLESTVEKHSAVLGRDALWKKTQRVASLSRYICFQFLRFFWKATPESRDHRGVKCKILRAVSFPEVKAT
jgi:ubiquitin carboxyl-terminal hydrolase 14